MIGSRSSVSAYLRCDINHRVNEIDQSRIGGLHSGSPGSVEPPRRVSRLLLLWPLAGFVAFFAVMIAYKPLDDTLMFWVEGIPCVITATLINIAWRRAQTGADVRSFLPRTIWLAIACLFVPLVLEVNGALDRSPVEQHRQVVTRKIHRRNRGSDSYYLELTSWRANRAHEEVTINEGWYLRAEPGDPVLVEAHRGALGIPLLVSVRQPD